MLCVMIFGEELATIQTFSCPANLILLSSSRTSVRVKLGLFNAKICNENRRYIHRLINQINEQDLLCHSI